MAGTPLFYPKVLNRAVAQFPFPVDLEQKRATMDKWITALKQGNLREIKEVSLHGDFLKDIFESVLGYPGIIAGGGNRWNLHAEKTTLSGGGSADGAIGFFDKGSHGRIIAPVELKGAKVDLDRQQARGYTPVEQGWRYANKAPGCHWVIVSNYREIRLYHTQRTFASYESFDLLDLADEAVFKRFYFIFCRENFLSETGESATDRLVNESGEAEQEITEKFYTEYKQMRRALFDTLCATNPSVNQSIILTKTQKLLDRILFICFCQSGYLLPNDTIARVFQQSAPGLSRWDWLKALFTAIDKGDERHSIPAYNGGLFAHDPILDKKLHVPDSACAVFQQLARYDYESQITVTILGHIFEQSISDLEALHAELRGETLTAITKRKREGVYYTPPHITRYIVKGALRRYLDEKFDALVAEHQPGDSKRRWLSVWRAYQQLLCKLRVLDPACGSGAFLVAAYEELFEAYNQVNATIAELMTGHPGQLRLDNLSKTILNNNLYGIDLNEEAVEITRLSLWIKTAEKGKPLNDLNHTIQTGNSLVDDPSIDTDAVDWQIRFPEVFSDGGFDIVIGNPPYIKFQNFRWSRMLEADWLVERYASARTGNFDMYLPFIEQGLQLLRAGGRMGYIAPSVWLMQQYGRGLRQWLSERRYLEQLIDFKSHQVFADATTYTALQFFRKAPLEKLQYTAAPTGALLSPAWSEIPYERLGSTPWVLLPPVEQKFVNRVTRNSVRLSLCTTAIFQGVITSADKVFHLEQLAPGRYYSKALRRPVDLEDETMRPLVSGPQATRYGLPVTATFLLFPYEIDEQDAAVLRSATELRKRFPNAWRYLRANEQALRQREHGRFDVDACWWQFGRSQNLDKQHIPKLMVPRLVVNLKAAADPDGVYSLDNVDVGGVLPAPGWDLYYLMAVMNSPVVNFIWRRISKPFRGDYRSANKQFLAPLPVPNVGKVVQKRIAQQAAVLAARYTEINEIRERVLHRLVTDFGTGKVTRKLQRWYTLDFFALHQEIKKVFKKSLSPAESDQWEAYLSEKRDQLNRLKIELDHREAELNQTLFRLYKLTDDDIRLVMGDKADLYSGEDNDL